MRERERGGLRRGRERGEVREHQNEPVWARSGGRDREGCLNIRMSPCGLVLVFETKERERGGVRDEGEGRCSRRGRGRGEVCEHQNEPVWARSGCQDGEGCPNIRTSPCGLVLMLKTRER